jgi:hypothetical protein
VNGLKKNESIPEEVIRKDSCQFANCEECGRRINLFALIDQVIEEDRKFLRDNIEGFEGKFRTEMSDEFKIIFDEIERTTKTNPICDKELHNLFDRCYYQSERTFRENFKELKLFFLEKQLQEKTSIKSVANFPDGHTAMVVSFPLSKNHWIYEDSGEPPAPLKIESIETRMHLESVFKDAVKYAVKASTLSGKEMDFDPDAMIQNFMVGLFGYVPLNFPRDTIKIKKEFEGKPLIELVLSKAKEKSNFYEDYQYWKNRTIKLEKKLLNDSELKEHKVISELRVKEILKEVV